MITLGPDHALLLAAAVGFHFTNQVLGARVSFGRKKFGVHYPSLYATHGMFISKDGQVDMREYEARGVEFNKLQRGHQHMFETVADAYALMLLCGLFYPKYSVQWGFVWTLGTLLYGVGYSVDPSWRLMGQMLCLPANCGWIYGLYCAGSALWNSQPL